MRIQDLDGSEWTVVLSVDDDGHLTVCANHADGSAPIDITDDLGLEDGEFAVRLSTQQIEEAA